MNDCLVIIFDVCELTAELSRFCFHKLGFKNVQIVRGTDGFVDKFLIFSKIATESDFRFFIRSDSDRLVFDGMLELVEKFRESDEIDNMEGFGFDYFMNKFRGATPQVYSKRCLERLNADNSLIANVPKPENYFSKNSKLVFSSQKIFTNLHDFGQKPSKACNSFVNRMVRDGLIHYDMRHLDSLPDCYKIAFRHAYTLMTTDKLKNKHDMDYIDFDFLDNEYDDSVSVDLEKSYQYYKTIYDNLLMKFTNEFE